MDLKEIRYTEKSINKSNCIAIVVTFNRKVLLLECIKTLLNQTVACDILVVDNASTDGTETYLCDCNILDESQIHYIRLPKNIGGSGGFHEGLKYCMAGRWDCFWLMDDDAVPENTALGNLLDSIIDRNDIYGSVAIGLFEESRRLCFPAKTISKTNQKKYNFIEYYEDLDNISSVAWLPFLGFLIHRPTVEKIGLPDPDFFILDDDIEYSERARTKGIKILLIKSSIIIHPLPLISVHRIFTKKIIYQNMPPWKAYYGARNKVIVAKKYYGKLLWLQTIPGIIFRALLGFLYEPKGFSSFYAHIIGIFDGLLGNKGKRFMPEITTFPPAHKTDGS